MTVCGRASEASSSRYEVDDDVCVKTIIPLAERVFSALPLVRFARTPGVYDIIMAFGVTVDGLIEEGVTKRRSITHLRISFDVSTLNVFA